MEPLLVDERSLQTVLPLDGQRSSESGSKETLMPELGMELWKAWDAMGMPIVPTGHLVGDALEVSLRTQTRPYDMIHVLAPRRMMIFVTLRSSIESDENVVVLRGGKDMDHIVGTGLRPKRDLQGVADEMAGRNDGHTDRIPGLPQFHPELRRTAFLLNQTHYCVGQFEGENVRLQGSLIDE